jgi:hypothetical protein
MSAGAATAAESKRDPQWMQRWLNKQPYVRTPRSMFPLAAVIDASGGSAIAALGYVHMKSAGGQPSSDGGGWEYNEWVLVKLDELAQWLDGCKNTAWRAIQRCVKLGVIETRKAGKYIEARTRIDRWEKATQARRDEMRQEREQREAALAKRKSAAAAVDEDDNGEDSDDEAVSASLTGGNFRERAALRFAPKPGGENCPASLHCPYYADAKANKGRIEFAVSSPMSIESNGLTKSIVTTPVDDRANGSHAASDVDVHPAAEANKSRNFFAVSSILAVEDKALSEIIVTTSVDDGKEDSLDNRCKKAIRTLVPAAAFDNWIRRATFVFDGESLEVRGNAFIVQEIQEEHHQAIRQAGRQVFGDETDVRYTAVAEPSQETVGPPAAELSDDGAMQYLRSTLDMLADVPLDRAIPLDFVTRQTARLCGVPLETFEGLLREKLHKFTKPGFLANIVDDAIASREQFLTRVAAAWRNGHV